jgi:ketosteroid isomerase-like protein
MSRENVETLRRSNAAFNQRDRAGGLADYDADVEWRDLKPAPESPERLVGIEAVSTYWDLWMEAFAEISAEIEEYVDAGDHVIAVTHWRARGEGSGIVTDLHTVDLYEFAGGKIVRATIGYPDRAAALEAIGRGE